MVRRAVCRRNDRHARVGRDRAVDAGDGGMVAYRKLINKPARIGKLPISFQSGMRIIDIQSVFALIQRESQRAYYLHNQSRPERTRLLHM